MTVTISLLIKYVLRGMRLSVMKWLIEASKPKLIQVLLIMARQKHSVIFARVHNSNIIYKSISKFGEKLISEAKVSHKQPVF